MNSSKKLHCSVTVSSLQYLGVGNSKMLRSSTTSLWLLLPERRGTQTPAQGISSARSSPANTPQTRTEVPSSRRQNHQFTHLRIHFLPTLCQRVAIPQTAAAAHCVSMSLKSFHWISRISPALPLHCPSQVNSLLYIFPPLHSVPSVSLMHFDN